MLDFFKKILFILIPTAVVLAAVNYAVDPFRLFHDLYVKSMAQSLRDKREIEIDRDFDYRSFQKHAIALMRRRPDIVMMGTSRGIEIGGDLFKERAFFNSCQPDGTLKEMIAIFDLYEAGGLIPRTVIMEIGPGFFSGNSKNEKWLTLYDEYYEGLRKIYSDDRMASVRIAVSRRVFGISKYRKWLYLFDPAYFKLSLKYAAASLKTGFEERFAPGGKGHDAGAHGSLHSDGSRRRSRLEEDKASGESDEAARAAVSSASQMRVEDPSIKKDFDSFISYLKRGGVETIILLVPVNPLTFDAANSRYGGTITFLEREIRAMAKDRSLEVIGAYDPRIYGLKNTDFLDGVHPKEYVYEKVIGPARRW